MEFIKDITQYFKNISIKKAKNNILYFLIGLIFASGDFIFSSLPFGIAFCAAVSKYPVSAFLGAFLGAILYPDFGFAYAMGVIAVIIIRIYISNLRFNESLVKRVIIVASAAAFISIERFIIFGFTASNLLFSIFTILLSILFTFLYSIYLYPQGHFIGLNEAGIASIMFTLLYIFNDVDIFGFSPSVIFAFLFSIFASANNGFMKGGILGLVCGLATGTDAAVYSPLIAICAIIFGIIYNFSESVSICSVLFISIIYGIYSSDINTVESIFQNVVMVIILYIAVSFLIKHFGFIKSRDKNNIKIYDYAIPTFTNSGVVSQRIDKLSKTYKELSDIFSSMSKHQTKVSSDEICYIIKDVFSTNCKNCANKDNCKEKNELLNKTIKLAKKFLNKGKEIIINENDCNNAGCSKKIISQINEEYKKLIVKKCEKDSCLDTANSMLDISRALSSVNDDASDLLPNPAIASKVSKALSELKIENSGVYAQGKRGITIFAYNIKPSNLKIGVKTLSKKLSEKCKIELDSPKITFDSKKYTLCISRRPNFVVDIASSQISENNNSLCGDSISNFQTAADFYSVICDGMGSGVDAACTSRMTCIMLEKLISGGCSTNIAIDMINKLLIKKFDEVFTTLDILQMDVFSGEANLYKAGSASSIIIRNGKKYEVSTKSTPAGIIDDIVFENIKLRLRENDIILMYSDGILDTFDCAENIFEATNLIKEKSAQLICDNLMQLASKSDKRKDDISLSVIKIKKI